MKDYKTKKIDRRKANPGYIGIVEKIDKNGKPIIRFSDKRNKPIKKYVFEMEELMNWYYKVEYNPTTKTWCLNRYLEGKQSINFYTIFESPDKKEVMKKYKEMKVSNSE